MSQQWTVTKDLFLTKNEVQRLYSVLRDAKDLGIQRGAFYCHIRDYYMLRLMLETGVRVFELTALRVSDFRSGSLIIRSGKGGKKRNILLSKETQRLLSDLIRAKKTVLKEPIGDEDHLFLSERQKPYSTRGVRKRVKLWFEKIGVSKHLSCHSTRHTYVSHMISAGVDLPLVRNNAGHSSLAVTSIYAHSVKDDLGELDIYSSNK